MTTQYVREKSLPFLGIGLGLQIMMIEFAGNILGYQDADSEEFREDSEHFVVSASQSGVYKQGVQMKIGAYAGKIVQGTIGEFLSLHPLIFRFVEKL
jgi:CTP synthase